MAILFHVFQGMILVALTVLTHALGSVYFIWTLTKHKPFLLRNRSFVVTILLLTWVVGNLLILHLLEILGWGLYYHAMGMFPDLETSVYYSLATYTTVGYGDVVLPRDWRLMGTSEALVGILMSAWSTALLIGVVNKFHDKLLEQLQGLTRGE